MVSAVGTSVCHRYQRMVRCRPFASLDDSCTVAVPSSGSLSVLSAVSVPSTWEFTRRKWVASYEIWTVLGSVANVGLPPAWVQRTLPSEFSQHSHERLKLFNSFINGRYASTCTLGPGVGVGGISDANVLETRTQTDFSSCCSFYAVLLRGAEYLLKRLQYVSLSRSSTLFMKPACSLVFTRTGH